MTVGEFNAALQQTTYIPEAYDGRKLEDVVTLEVVGDINFRIQFPVTIERTKLPVLTQRKSNSIKDRVTVITKTYLRYPCVDRLIKSIAAFYPGITVIVADDNPTDHFQELKNPLVTVKQYKMPAREGWFAGRALAQSQVRTQFYLWVDDDFIFSEETNLEYMVAVAENTGYDIIGGALNGHVMGGWAKNDFLDLQKSPDGYCFDRKKYSSFHLPGYENECQVVDIIENFFLARTTTVGKIRFAMIWLMAALNKTLEIHEVNQSETVESKYEEIYFEREEYFNQFNLQERKNMLIDLFESDDDEKIIRQGLTIIKHESNLEIWKAIASWRNEFVSRVDGNLASLVDENLQISIKEAYSNLVWYTRTDLSDDEAIVADLACVVRNQACLKDVEKKYQAAVENKGYIFNENEDFLIRRHFSAVLDRNELDTKKLFSFIDEKEFDPPLAIQGPKVVIMGILATFFQKLNETEKCTQISGMLTTSSGTIAVYEASYLTFALAIKCDINLARFSNEKTEEILMTNNSRFSWQILEKIEEQKEYSDHLKTLFLHSKAHLMPLND
ncbi:Oidioi.mRNA.OKI2018_I69.chr2.g6312.t1.cds [Oikopleura dioica]|uniref:Oidioi.mRNA.OKI2018_I69.chr2.g6312.t1.cds n=1 Tax=Oikopleura dioica TaxID=34765 RepID=A0ABN7T3I7_OIKDI|nr:Oidioi.mRNA.OKI2018_I69.chr2.g6312.t1.cds [Oikopleura dioica]